MFDWLDYNFMVRALAATTAMSFAMAPIGAFLVLRRLSLAGEAMATVPAARAVPATMAIIRRTMKLLSVGN